MATVITMSPETFCTDLLNTIDTILNNFVQTGFERLVQNYQGVLTSLMIFYVGWIGFRMMTRSLQIDIVVFAKHLSLLIIVYALLNNWQLFYLFFYNIFTNEPTNICQVLVNSSGNFNLQGESTSSALNEVFYQGITASQKLLSLTGFGNYMVFVYGILVGTATCIFCLIALAMLIYAKMLLALLLFLAPIFISFLLWNSTRRLFDKWLQALINYALYPIITCGVLMLTLTLANTTLPGLMTNVSSGNPTFSGVSIYVFLLIICGLILKQVKYICADLSAGVAVEGISAAIGIGKQAINSAISVGNTSGKVFGGVFKQPRIHQSQTSRQVNERAACD